MGRIVILASYKFYFNRVIKNLVQHPSNNICIMVHQGGREQCTKNLSVPKVFISIYISDVSEILQGCPLNFA